MGKPVGITVLAVMLCSGYLKLGRQVGVRVGIGKVMWFYRKGTYVLRF